MEFLSVASAADLAIAGMLTAAFIVYAWWRDTGGLILIAISLPIAGFFYTHFPYHTELANMLPLGGALNFIFFALLLGLSVWVVRRTIGTGLGGTRAIHIITTSVALTVLLVAFAYHIVPVTGIHEFSPLFDSFFASATNFFWIVALALLALFVV